MTALRVARPDDRVVVETLVAAAYGPYIARIGRKPGPMLDDYAASIAAGHVHVATDDLGAVLGLVVLIPESDAMLLDNVAVDPALRGAGVGRCLIQFAEAEARRVGLPAIRLYTHEMMTENIALYGRYGYRETHRAEEKGFRRVFMTKALT